MERPIAFHGRLLLPREMRYCARRRELLAIVEMVQYFRVYLAGRSFIIRTDHDSLKGVKQLAKLTGQMARWIDFLEGFQFEIQTRPGKEHDNADFLSRLYTDCFCKHRENFEMTSTAEEALRDEPVKDWELFERCCREQADRRIRDKRSEILRITDPEALRTLSDHDLEEQLNIASKMSTPMEVKVQVAKVHAVMVCRTSTPVARVRCVRLATECRSWIPMWTREEMKTHQVEDDDIKVLYKALSSDTVVCPDWKDITFEGLGCKYYHGQWSRLRMIDGLLYRKWESADGVMTWYQLVVPREFQRTIIEQVHKTSVGSHQGFRRTWEFLRRRFHWFEMAKQVKIYIRACPECQRKKHQSTNPKWPMTLYGAGFRNERVTLDMCGPIKFARVPYTYLLVICDVFTKYVVAVPLRTSEAVDIMQAFLDRWCNVFGFPYHIHTDQGSNLT